MRATSDERQEGGKEKRSRNGNERSDFQWSTVENPLRDYHQSRLCLIWLSINRITRAKLGNRSKEKKRGKKEKKSKRERIGIDEGLLPSAGGERFVIFTRNTHRHTTHRSRVAASSRATTNKRTWETAHVMWCAMVSPTCVRRRRARRVLPDDVVGGQRSTEEPEYFRSGYSHAGSWCLVTAYRNFRVVVLDDIVELLIRTWSLDAPAADWFCFVAKWAAVIAVTIQHRYSE